MEERGAALTRIVLDVSAVAPLFLNDEASDILPGLPDALQSGAVLVPGHWLAEVANAVLVASTRKRLDEEGVARATDMIAALQVEIDPSGSNRTFGAVWKHARDYGLTIYDAAYVELAQRSELAFATNDRALIKAARAIGVPLFGR